MLNQPQTADPHKADVYSLCKTMYVLATGQKYPPPGQHTHFETSLRHNCSEITAYFLDPYLTAATAYDPDKRPSMTELATLLQAWESAPEAVIGLEANQSRRVRGDF